MRGGRTAARRPDWLERAAVAALVCVALAASAAAVRLGVAAGAGTEDLLAAVRARTERRVAAEREQIRSVLDAAARDGRETARRAAEAALGVHEGNSQLRLLLAGVYRDNGATAPALHEYRRAVELLRDYADHRSPLFIGSVLSPWLREVRPFVSGTALGDLHYLQRALAGGCS